MTSNKPADMDRFRVRVRVRVWKLQGSRKEARLIREITAKIKWQQKKFSLAEAEPTSSVNNPKSNLCQKYHQKIVEGTKASPIFTYVDTDPFVIKTEVAEYKSLHPAGKLPHLVSEMIKARLGREISNSLDTNVIKRNIAVSENVTATERLNSLVPEVMYIMLDVREVLGLDEASEDIRLARLAYSSGIVSNPPLSNDDEPNVVLVDSYKIEYWTSDASIKKKDKPKALSYFHTPSCFIDLPDSGQVVVSVNGELQTADGYSGKMLYVNYLFDTPEGFVDCQNFTMKGTTQYCLNNGGKCIFSHPLEAKFSTANISDNCDIRFFAEVFSYDSEHSTLQGYGYTTIPVRPGTHHLTVNTWKPIYKSATKRALSSIIPNKSILIPDIRLLAEPGDFQEKFMVFDQITTQATGSVTITLNFIIQTSRIKEKLEIDIPQIKEEKISASELTVETVIEAFQEAREQLWNAIEKLKTI